MNLTPNFVSITPLRVRYNDATEATRLYVALQNDNLQTECTFLYVLRDSKNKALGSGTVKMSGTDYSNWSGDNSTPYTYVASKINVTIVTSTSGNSGSAGSSGSAGHA